MELTELKDDVGHLSTENLELRIKIKDIII